MTDKTRTELIEDGKLVDYTEEAGALGFRWPMAMTAALDEAIRASLPPLMRAGSPGDTMAQVIEEQGMGAALHEVFAATAEVLASADSMGLSNSNQVAIDLAAPWKEDFVLAMLLRVENDEGTPCFTLDLQG